jgi:hypothetical protein
VRHLGQWTTAFALSVVSVLVALPASGASRPERINVATFEGRWIDLSKGWDGARACVVAPNRPTACFRDQAEADAFLDSIATPDASCSTPLRLYDGTGFNPPSVSITIRGLWVDLSTLSFDNKTSSYKVGACSVEIAAMSQGGGAWYPICLNAGCQESSMISGWDNVASSVFLN